MSQEISDVDLVAQCLLAVADGPFVADGEFETITGVSLGEVRALLEMWPAYPAIDETRVATIVERGLSSLLSYPNPLREEAWPRFLSVAPRRVERLVQRWKRRAKQLNEELRLEQARPGGLCLGGPGWHSLELRVSAREYEAMHDFWDGNWLAATLHLRTAFPSVAVERMWLRATEFVHLSSALHAVLKGEVRTFKWGTLEPWVELQGELDEVGRLRVDGRLGMSREKPEFTLWCSRAQVEAAARDVDALCEAFPVRGE